MAAKKKTRAARKKRGSRRPASRGRAQRTKTGRRGGRGRARTRKKIARKRPAGKRKAAARRRPVRKRPHRKKSARKAGTGRARARKNAGRKRVTKSASTQKRTLKSVPAAPGFKPKVVVLPPPVAPWVGSATLPATEDLSSELDQILREDDNDDDYFDEE